MNEWFTLYRLQKYISAAYISKCRTTNPYRLQKTKFNMVTNYSPPSFSNIVAYFSLCRSLISYICGGSCTKATNFSSGLLLITMSYGIWKNYLCSGNKDSMYCVLPEWSNIFLVRTIRISANTRAAAHPAKKPENRLTVSTERRNENQNLFSFHPQSNKILNYTSVLTHGKRNSVSFPLCFWS